MPFIVFSRKRRVRVVITRREALDSPDGVNIFIVALAQALVDLGHEVRLVVGSLGNFPEYHRALAPRIDLPIIALSRTPLSGFAAVAGWLRAKWVVDRFRPDLVIHCEAVPLAFPGIVVQVVHDLERRSGRLAPIRRAIRRFSSRRCDYVVATTTELRDELVRDLGLRAEEIAIIPKCLDLQAYRGASLAARERAILHSGTLPYKDPGTTIRAFGTLDDPSVELYIAGDITGPTQEAMNALPKRIRERVSLLGPADHEAVRSLYGRVRIASFPTRYTIPVGSGTVMEAIASGTPIVGSARLSRDVLADGENGLVTDMEPEAIAVAFRALLNDNALWMRLSEGANRMIKRFDAAQVARQYLTLASAKCGHPI